MVRILVFVLMAPLLCLGQESSTVKEKGKPGVEFLETWNWEQVREKAKSEHKFIFIDCFATWCGPCKMMDSKTYVDEEVGRVVNEGFLSIKVQCDSSRNDGDVIKSQYADAHRIVEEFKINAFPTFLFFSPDGNLVHKDMGFSPPNEFIEVVTAAKNPNEQYYTQIALYRSGGLGYEKMPVIAATARKFGDLEIYREICNKYVKEYLNQLPDSAFRGKDILDNLVDNAPFLSTDDRIFKWVLTHQDMADSIVGEKNVASWLTNSVIYKAIVEPTIVKAKQTGKSPDWIGITNEITSRYGKEHATETILKGKMGWFEYEKDWENYFAAGIERIENARLDEISQNLTMLNNFAFEIFQRSNDRTKLETALSWMRLPEGSALNTMPHAGTFLDTKANLLYKLGRKDEALPLEAKAAELQPKDKGISMALAKMQEGKPTW